MAFEQSFLERLRDALPLADLVGRRVRLTKRGREYSGLCPFHKEKSPSFTVNEDKGFFHCFGCGAHGDVISFVMQSEGLSFPEAVEKLAGLAGLEMPRRESRGSAEERAAKGLHEALEAAACWFQQQLSGARGESARAYLARRGVTASSLDTFRLGYAPDARGLLHAALREQGFGEALLIEAGLAKRGEGGGALRDYFFDRVIFPITDRRGRVVAFGGRALAADAKAKYLNSPDGPLFHKGTLVYNLPRAREALREGAELVVCEGYMDVIAMAQAGFAASVAPLGTAVTEAQLALLWKISPEPILCLDGDAAGARAALRAAERALPLLLPGQSLRFATLPAGEDPDSLLASRGASAMAQVLKSARPLADVVWQGALAACRPDTPERQAALRAELLRASQRVRDREVSQAYRHEMLRRFDAAFGFLGRRRRAAGRGAAAAAVVAPAAQRPSPAALRNRPEQVLLALAVNHPVLAAERAEEIARLRFAVPEFRQMAAALIDWLAHAPHLDSPSLRCHLSEQGFSGLLDRVLGSSTTVHEPLARPDGALAEARRRIAYWILRVGESSGVEERDETYARLIEESDSGETSDVHLDRVAAERVLAQESTAEQRVIERFEPIVSDT